MGSPSKSQGSSLKLIAKFRMTSIRGAHTEALVAKLNLLEFKSVSGKRIREPLRSTPVVFVFRHSFLCDLGVFAGNLPGLVAAMPALHPPQPSETKPEKKSFSQRRKDRRNARKEKHWAQASLCGPGAHGPLEHEFAALVTFQNASSMFAVDVEPARHLKRAAPKADEAGTHSAPGLNA